MFSEPTRGLNYAYNYRDIDGIKVPTQRRIYGDDGGGHQIPNPVLISIDISEMEFVEG